MDVRIELLPGAPLRLDDLGGLPLDVTPPGYQRRTWETTVLAPLIATLAGQWRQTHGIGVLWWQEGRLLYLPLHRLPATASGVIAAARAAWDQGCVPVYLAAENGCVAQTQVAVRDLRWEDRYRQ